MPTYTDTRYYIPSYSLSITPNYSNNPQYVLMTAMSGSPVKIYWPKASPTETDGTRRHLIEDFLGMSGTEYRFWSLSAYNTVLNNEVSEKAVAIYLRLDTSMVALVTLCNAEESKSEVEFDDEGVIKYAWLKIGQLSAPDPTTNLRSITSLDFGCLSTDAAYAEGSDNEWYTRDQSTKQASMQTGWSFSGFVARSLKLLKDNTTEWYDINGVLVDTDPSTVPSASPESLSLNSSLSTPHSSLLSGSWWYNKVLPWLKGEFTTLLRGFFVQKDVTGTEVMKGSLQTASLISDGEITATGDISASNAFISNDVSAENNITAGNTLSATHVTADEDAVSPVFSTAGDIETAQSDALTSSGASVYGDASGGHVVTDYLSVRRAAWFRSVTIEEVRHVGGELILSQAACQISRVEPIYADDGATVISYRCYFPTTANGKSQYNEWAVGDQARCQVFNLTANNSSNVQTRYYWRLVTAVHSATENETEHYIDLSASICDGTSIPDADDNIVLLGHRGAETDGMYSRCSAQVYSTAEVHAPSRRYYLNITSFNLSDANAIEILEWVPASSDTKGYVHWKVGADENYIDFSNGEMSMKCLGEVTISSNKFNIKNGNEVAALFENGMIKANYIDAKSLDVTKLTSKSSDGKNIVDIHDGKVTISSIDDADNTQQVGLENTSDTYIWAGGSTTDAPFRVTKSGKVYASEGVFPKATIDQAEIFRTISPWTPVVSEDVADNYYFPSDCDDKNFDLPNGINNVGRVIRVTTDDLGETITDRQLKLQIANNNDNKLFFYEDGLRKTELIISNEMVELIGRGSSTSFTGYIVIRRVDLMTRSNIGHPIKAVAFGELVHNQDEDPKIYYKRYDAQDVNVGDTNFTGSFYSDPLYKYYKIMLPSTWRIEKNNFVVFVQGIGGSKVYTLHIVNADDDGRVNFFTIKTPIDTTDYYPHCFFYIFNMLDWANVDGSIKINEETLSWNTKEYDFMDMIKDDNSDESTNKYDYSSIGTFDE